MLQAGSDGGQPVTPAGPGGLLRTSLSVPSLSGITGNGLHPASATIAELYRTDSGSRSLGKGGGGGTALLPCQGAHAASQLRRY